MICAEIAEIETLEELTGKESGAIHWQDGNIDIFNWSGVTGIPRNFCDGWVVFFDIECAEKCDVDRAAMHAMAEHAGHLDDFSEYESYIVNENIVLTINKNWE